MRAENQRRCDIVPAPAEKQLPSEIAARSNGPAIIHCIVIAYTANEANQCSPI